MAAESEPNSATVTVRLELTILGQPVCGSVEMPAAPVGLSAMLPIFQSLANVVVDAAVRVTEAEGHCISCKKGCGACCRQLVPLAEAEARQVRDLVDHLPEPRRSAIRARFVDARRRLEESGRLESLQKRDAWGSGDHHPVGLDYFDLQIACPFLEDEACSIYSERPIACRQYLVTTPAEHCAHPSAATVRSVPMPGKIWAAVALFDPIPADQETIRWVPLVLALDWAESHPEEPEPRPAVELLSEFIERLTGTVLPIS